MTSAGFGRRRGLRRITSRTAIDDERVSLGLECGHSVVRNRRADGQQAVCRECIDADRIATEARRAKKYGVPA